MRVHHDEAFWQGHLNTIDEQGISASAYALREGLAVASLYYWRTRLRKQSAQRATHAGDSNGAGLFIPLSMTTSHKNAEQDACVLSLGPSLRLALSNLPSAQWLAQVCQALAREVF